MINFIGEIDGIEVISRGFNRLDSIDDFRPLWPEVIKTFYEIEAEQFNTEGQAGGERWAPLSPVYKRWKEVHYPGEPILQREHDLVDSLTDPDALDAILRPSVDELEIGTGVPYAIHHQRGGRPPINMSETQKRKIQKSIQVGLVRFIREAGFQVEERAA